MLYRFADKLIVLSNFNQMLSADFRRHRRQIQRAILDESLSFRFQPLPNCSPFEQSHKVVPVIDTQDYTIGESGFVAAASLTVWEAIKYFEYVLSKTFSTFSNDPRMTMNIVVHWNTMKSDLVLYHLGSLLHRYSFSPWRLVIETEDLGEERNKEAERRIDGIRELGVRVIVNGMQRTDSPLL